MNRHKRSDQGLPGLNFTIGLSGERQASAAGRSMLHGNAVVKAGPQLAYHYHDGDNFGVSGLEIAPLRWTPDGWPVLAAVPD